MVPERDMVSNLLSCVGCQENDVILFAVPGYTLRSRTEGSTSSLPTTVYWISCKCMAVLSFNKAPSRLCLQNIREEIGFSNRLMALRFIFHWFISRVSQLYFSFNNLHNDSGWWIGTYVQGSSCDVLYVTIWYEGLMRLRITCYLIYTYSAVHGNLKV